MGLGRCVELGNEQKIEEMRLEGEMKMRREDESCF
jgi:hypothetical protein